MSGMSYKRKQDEAPLTLRPLPIDGDGERRWAAIARLDSGDEYAETHEYPAAALANLIRTLVDVLNAQNAALGRPA